MAPTDPFPSLYPMIAPIHTGRLAVSDGAELYYEVSGREDGSPVVYLHGGPGSGFTPHARRYMDPAVYKIITFEQRGAGRSTPHADIAANDTARLLADIEALRAHLGVARWVVFGISWGACLGLVYAERWPERVAALVLSGVFLGTRAEIAWWFDPAGVRRFYPELYDGLVAALPEGRRGSAQAVTDGYLEAMTSQAEAEIFDALDFDDPTVPLAQFRRSAIYRWTEYEALMSTPDADPLSVLERLRARGRDYVKAHSLIECWYFANACFLEDGQILRDAGALAETPTLIAQNRFDMICPPGAVHDLALRLPRAEITWLTGGHLVGDATGRAIRAQFDRLARTEALS